MRQKVIKKKSPQPAIAVTVRVMKPECGSRLLSFGLAAMSRPPTRASNPAHLRQLNYCSRKRKTRMNSDEFFS